MEESIALSIRSHCVGTTAVIYASDYLRVRIALGLGAGDPDRVRLKS